MGHTVFAKIKMPTPEEKADELWKIWNFYWMEPELITKQKLAQLVGHIDKAMWEQGIDMTDYFAKVKRLIYEK